jgi:heme-degrading monooxygenase HmoA
MPHILVRHRVEDYNKWKPAYDAHASARTAGGSQGAKLFRNASDPNELIILLTWSDLDAAHRFAESADLREVMRKAGVQGTPDIAYLEEVEQTPS